MLGCAGKMPDPEGPKVPEVSGTGVPLCDAQALVLTSAGNPDWLETEVNKALRWWAKRIPALLIYAGKLHRPAGDPMPGWVLIDIAPTETTDTWVTSNVEPGYQHFVGAVTNVLISRPYDCVIGAEVQLHSRYGPNDGAMVQNMLRHEIGHILGLSHSETGLMMPLHDRDGPLQDLSPESLRELVTLYERFRR